MGIHAAHSPQDSTGTFGGGSSVPAQHAGKALLALSSSSSSTVAAGHPASVHFAPDAARRDHTHPKAKGNGAQGTKGASTEANTGIGASSSKTTPRPSKPKTQTSMPSMSSSSSVFAGAADSAWGANFWVTLVEPQTGTPFYACPATGEVSWDPPVGNFVLPPSTEGEWWELVDESRGIPYYYHTKTNATVWEKPEGFVIPLGILQNSALGRRLSLRYSQSFDPAALPSISEPNDSQSQ
ncbi:hypothetical protein SCHPADRAFT_837440, partial [Schizopora paradoxa]